MFLRSFAYKDSNPNGWCFKPFKLDNSNLLVGLSGSGKSRFIGTLWAFANYQVGNTPALINNSTQMPTSGSWDITLEDGKDTYEIQFTTSAQVSPGKLPDIEKEIINRKSPGSEPVELVKRMGDEFYYNGQKLPTFPSNQSAVSLLQREQSIRPLYIGLQHMMRRDFHGAILSVATGMQGVSAAVKVNSDKKPSLEQLWGLDLSLSLKLYFLQLHFQVIFKNIENQYKSVFPNIEELRIRSLPNTGLAPFGSSIPYLFVKEKGIATDIRIDEMSSGMIKTLLIITDIASLPGPAIYIIDEYENSLGINAIDFLPKLLIEHANTAQFIVTTHHPYLINQIPVSYWKIFTRNKSTVSVRDGADLIEKYGKSKQRQFVQLMNDLEKGNL